MGTIVEVNGLIYYDGNQREQVRFQGRNRNGHPVTGVARSGESAADLAYRLYRNGYKHASVFIGTRRAGGVDHDGHRRIWWGEHDD